MMRIFFFLAFLAIVALVVTGAIKMQKTDDTITIEINRKAVREDARKVIDKGRSALGEAETALQRNSESNPR